MRYYIGIDLGTSAVKLLLTDGAGAVLRAVSREYPLCFPQPGWSEQAPEDWWDAVCDAMPELLLGVDASLVAAIGCAGTSRKTSRALKRSCCPRIISTIS